MTTDPTAANTALGAYEKQVASDEAAAAAALAAETTKEQADQVTIAQQAAQIAQLEHGQPTKTRYGYSTYTGDWTVSDTKYAHKPGTGVARHYFTGLPGAIPAALTDGRTLSLSFNTSNMAGDLPAIEAAVLGWDKQLPKGTVVYLCPWHEYDHAEGSSPQTFISGMGLFTPAIAALKPKLTNIVLFSKAMSTAYLFSGLSTHKPSDFALTGAAVPDVFSIDCDGRDSTSAYHDFTPEVTAAVAFAKAAGYKMFAVDELGCGRTSTDLTGAGRATYLQTETTMIGTVGAAAGLTVVTVCVWEYQSFPRYYITPGSPECGVVTQLVASS